MADAPRIIITPESRPKPLTPLVRPSRRRRRRWRERWWGARYARAVRSGPWYRSVGLVLAGLVGLGASAAVAVVVAWLGYAAWLRPQLPDAFELAAATRAQPTLVYAASGEKLTQFEPRFREWVPLDSVPLPFVHALIATEDRRFYAHGGVDLRRLVGALVYTAQGDRQGGSTVTQQLTRNLFPAEIGNVGLLERKTKEVLAARAIEGAHTKREILEAYVNTAPFLYNAHGVEMAARTYFGHPAREMSLAESALLVAMLKGPNRYNPVRYPERARERRDLVLRLMAETGHVDAAAARAAQAEPLGVELRPQPGASSLAPHFTEMVRRRLQAWAEKKGYDLERDGLVVHTALDLGMQREAEAAVAEQVPRVAARGGARITRATVDVHLRRTPAYARAVAGGATEPDALAAVRADRALVDSVQAAATRLQTGLVAIDPATGFVRAYVGSRDAVREEYDHAGVAVRQPGSVFKAVVYAAAVQRGYGPPDRVEDRAPEVDMGGGRTWRPTNAGGGASGRTVTIADAFAYSKNTVAAQIGMELGPARLALVARRLGIESELDAVPSLALGTSPVTVLEMTGAYAALANDGRYRTPRFIRRIESSTGRVIQEFGGEGIQAVTRRDARTMVGLMREVVRRGTGRDVRAYGVAGDVGGKTGTTQRNADGWFMLVHPRLVTGVWVGYDDQRVTFGRGKRGYGSRTALPVAAAFHARVQDGLGPALFPEAPGYGERLAGGEPDTTGFADPDDAAYDDFDWDAYFEGSGGIDPVDPPAPVEVETVRPDVARPAIGPDARRRAATGRLPTAPPAPEPAPEPEPVPEAAPAEPRDAGRIGWTDRPPTVDDG